ncbi:MAG: DNA damage-inducible protein D [Prevotella sp.]|nr:DNA damage-inducible protein D [Prevotella sp.]
MSSKLTKRAKETFENIKRVDENGYEYRTARDLYKALEYTEYRNFLPAARKAWTACQQSGFNPHDHFVPFNDMVKIGSGAERQIDNIKMSRYACYLTVQNADSSKPIVAQAQTYFALQTRRAELFLDRSQLTEEDKRRLLLRREMKKHNAQLAGAAKNAGVETSKDYAIFQNAGYEGLYAGLNKKDIHERKGLSKSQDILDHMGSTELAANLFRATQTEEKLKKDNVKGKEKANLVHRQIGAKVRKAIEDIGGTMPEDLPVAENIKKIERKEKNLKQIKGDKNKEDEQ